MRRMCCLHRREGDLSWLGRTFSIATVMSCLDHPISCCARGSKLWYCIADIGCNICFINSMLWLGEHIEIRHSGTSVNSSCRLLGHVFWIEGVSIVSKIIQSDFFTSVLDAGYIDSRCVTSIPIQRIRRTYRFIDQSESKCNHDARMATTSLSKPYPAGYSREVKC